jgi:hypothetical protein
LKFKRFFAFLSLSLSLSLSLFLSFLFGLGTFGGHSTAGKSPVICGFARNSRLILKSNSRAVDVASEHIKMFYRRVPSALYHLVLIVFSLKRGMLRPLGGVHSDPLGLPPPRRPPAAAQPLAADPSRRNCRRNCFEG